MILERTLISDLVNKSISIPTEVKYWDGYEEKIGNGPTEVKINFNEKIDWDAISNDASIALAEAYMDRKIEIEGSLQDLLVSVWNNEESFLNDNKFISQILSKHDKKTSSEDISYHYDIGNDFYEMWLDDSMTYSCAYFHTEEDSLEAAQEQKRQHIYNKLRLEEGDQLLDIGCGWGDLIIDGAKKYGVKATGCTLSQEQFNHVSNRIKNEGLEGQVEVKFTDYRDLPKEGKKYNKICSVGMLEHVGRDNITKYFKTIDLLLANQGFALINSITGHRDPDDKSKGGNGFLNKYIFPGGYIPTISEIVYGINKQNLALIDVESLRRHYQLTLEEWYRRFVENWDEIEKTKDDRFMRMWEIFLTACAALFEAGKSDVCQYLIEKGTDNTRPLTREYML